MQTSGPFQNGSLARKISSTRLQTGTGSPAATSLRFGGGGAVPDLGTVTNIAAKGMEFVGGTRGKQMIWEDFVGFGLLRTWMDLQRGNGDSPWNIPAAGERLFREGSSILTDNLLGGLVAAGLGKFWLDRNNKSFSNTFIDYPTLNLFQTHLKNAGDGGEAAFLKQLGQHLQSSVAQGNPAQLQSLLQKAWDLGKTQAQGLNDKADGDQQLASIAKEFVKTINPAKATFDLELKALTTGEKVAPELFNIQNLLDDVSKFSKHMATVTQTAANQNLKTSWTELAEAGIKSTLRAKNIKLPIGLAAGMGATFAMPFLNAFFTRKMYGINYYPGELGLRPEKPEKERSQKNFGERYFPYAEEERKKGNYLPIALSLLPLPLAMGVMDVVKMKLVNPFNTQNAKTLFDFCKGKPFTAPQQMASMFALLITSRLMCSRSDNEFRERFVDSFAGWGIWILGTPLMKLAIAKGLDATGKTALLKQNPDASSWRKMVLKSDHEIASLMEGSLSKTGAEAAKIIKATQRANVWMGAGSMAASVLLLGVVEPWIGIRWTQRNERNKQAKAQEALKGFYPGVAPNTPNLTPIFSPNALPSNSTSTTIFSASNSTPIQFPVPAQPFQFPNSQAPTPIAFANTTGSPFLTRP